MGDFGGHGLSETIAFQAKLTNNQERLCLTQRIPEQSFSNEVPGMLTMLPNTRNAGYSKSALVDIFDLFVYLFYCFSNDSKGQPGSFSWLQF